MVTKDVFFQEKEIPTIKEKSANPAQSFVCLLFGFCREKCLGATRLENLLAILAHIHLFAGGGNHETQTRREKVGCMLSQEQGVAAHLSQLREFFRASAALCRGSSSPLT